MGHFRSILKSGHFRSFSVTPTSTYKNGNIWKQILITFFILSNFIYRQSGASQLGPGTLGPIIIYIGPFLNFSYYFTIFREKIRTFWWMAERTSPPALEKFDGPTTLKNILSLKWLKRMNLCITKMGKNQKNDMCLFQYLCHSNITCYISGWYHVYCELHACRYYL